MGWDEMSELDLLSFTHTSKAQELDSSIENKSLHPPNFEPWT
jgi:hypothetical protein